MASDSNAIWSDGKRKITGSWSYIWHKNAFSVRLDKWYRGFEGRSLDFYISGDSPEWGPWKLKRSKCYPEKDGAK